MELQRGCVYFFRHIGLTPIKIGYSQNESPIKRFNQFKTYAPFGSEIIGFIIISNPKEIETSLHNKYSSKRLSGEWFDITEEEAIKEINFYTNISDVQDRNEFQIEWAKHIQNNKDKITEELTSNQKKNSIEYFSKIYKHDKKINRTKIAEKLGVTRQTIVKWINIIESKK